MAGRASSGSVMPTLARPSVRSRQRSTPSGPRWAATCSQPRSQPRRGPCCRGRRSSPQPLAWPPGARRRSRGWTAMTTSTLVVVDDDAEAVVGPRGGRWPPRPRAWRCRAWRPDIEPERSSTIARLTGGRRRASRWPAAPSMRGDEEALAVRAGADERRSWRTVRSVAGWSVMTGPPRGVLGRSSRDGPPACSGSGSTADGRGARRRGPGRSVPTGSGRRRWRSSGRPRSASSAGRRLRIGGIAVRGRQSAGGASIASRRASAPVGRVGPMRGGRSRGSRTRAQVVERRVRRRPVVLLGQGADGRRRRGRRGAGGSRRAAGAPAGVAGSGAAGRGARRRTWRRGRAGRRRQQARAPGSSGPSGASPRPGRPAR